MRILVFFFFYIAFASVSSAMWRPAEQPKVEILASAEYMGATVKVTVIGRTEPGFHLYSVKPQGEFGPKPTRLVIEQPEARSMGPLTESKPTLIVDLALGESLQVHQGEFWIARSFTPKVKQPFIRGYLYYQLCDNLICLNPVKQPFQVQLP